MTIPYLNTARPVPMSDIPEEYRDIAEAIGLEAFTQLTLLCGGQTGAISRIVYTLVGAAGLWCISLLFGERVSAKE